MSAWCWTIGAIAVLATLVVLWLTYDEEGTHGDIFSKRRRP